MKKIISLQNTEIKAVAGLAKANNRQEQNRFIAEGNRVCSALVASNMQLEMLYVTFSMLPQAISFCPNEKITEVSEDVMKKISLSHSPSGILGIFSIPARPQPSELSEGIVLLEVSDPGNAGTLIRSCAAMGKKTVVFVDGVDPWHPKVIQSCAGSIGLVNVFQLPWEQLLAIKNNLKLCALVVQGGKKSNEINFSDILFVIGNEAHGIPKNKLEQCDYKLTLEMPGNVESLNAAIAGSIALYFAWNAKNNHPINN